MLEREVCNRSRSPSLALGVFWGGLYPLRINVHKELRSFLERTDPVRRESLTPLLGRGQQWAGTRGEVGDSALCHPACHPHWSVHPVCCSPERVVSSGPLTQTPPVDLRPSHSCICHGVLEHGPPLRDALWT